MANRTRTYRQKLTVEQERALVRDARDGDQDALEALIGHHYDAMYRLALKYTRDPHRAQEAIQESCVQVLRYIGQFRSEARFGSWMARIVINAVRLRHRREKRLVPIGDALEFDRPAPGPSPARMVADRQLLGMIDDFLQDGRDGDYELFLMRYVDEEAVRDVAERAGISMSAVKTRVHRARNKLRHHATASQWHAGL